MQGTALQIAQQACMELGLVKPTELMTSGQATDIQLLALFNAAGNELLTYFEWQFLVRTATITGVAAQPLYPRPSDYDKQINQSIWDYGNRRPVFGPISTQGWQLVINSQISTGPFARYRVTDNNVEINPTPSGGESYNYVYVSNGWVQSYLDLSVRTTMIENDADVPLFDMWLLTKFLKLKLWEAKGLDTTTLRDDFSRTFNVLTGNDVGGPVLSLSPRCQLPYISIGNIPDGSWPVT